MGVQPFEQILDTETLTTDMTNTAFVILIHGFHNKTYQTGGFVIQARSDRFPWHCWDGSPILRHG